MVAVLAVGFLFLLRRGKAPAGTTIEVVLRFPAEKVFKRIGLHDKEDA